MNSRRRTVSWLLSGVLLVLLASALLACSGGEADPTSPAETAPVEEATSEAVPTEGVGADPTAPADDPTEVPQPTTAPDTLSTTAVELPEMGLVVEVPEPWIRLEPDTVWVPEVTEAPAAMIHPRIGVKMVELEAPAEAEAILLPQPAQTLSSESAALPLGEGRSFVMEVYGIADEGSDEQAEVISVEKHVLVSVASGERRLAYDFYAAAASVEALADLEAVLTHMVDTVAATAMPAPPEGGQASLDSPAVVQAKARLAQHLGVSADEITAVSAEFVEWSDACLGVHSAGQMCAQVITPGYRIMLEAAGKQYEVHTDRNGTSVAILSP